MRSSPQIPDRYLHFDNFDVGTVQISANCSRCGQSFKGVAKRGEHVDDVLLRIRAEYDAHECP